MKLLLYEIIPRAGFNLATGRFWPAGRMFDTHGIEDKNARIHGNSTIRISELHETAINSKERSQCYLFLIRM